MARRTGSYDSDDEGMVDDVHHGAPDGSNVMALEDSTGGGDVDKGTAGAGTDAYASSSCLVVFSKIFFAIGSGLYLWLAVDTLAFYRHYEGIPYNVLTADDDATWWDHYEETGAVPASVLETEDADVRAAWYESTLFEGGRDDYIFQAVKGRDGSRVSEGMSIYFAASTCLLLTGLLEGCCCGASRTWGGRLPYWTVALAAAFGVASASLTEKDGDLATILTAVSAQIYCLAALALLLLGCAGGGGCRRLWTILAHLCFVLGTAGGVTLSYLRIFEQFEVWHAYMAIGAASCWCAAAVVYLAAAVSVACGGFLGGMPGETIGRRSGTDGSNDDDEEDDGDDQKDDEDDDSSEEDDHGGYLKRQSQQRPDPSAPLEPTESNDEESVTSLWTAGPGPEKKEDIARSSLDMIFGRTGTSSKSNSYYA